MSTSKQVEANRRNSLKGGVKSEEGKAISRLNARKHGIFAAALTPEDSEQAAGIEDELISSLQPVGRVEEMLVEKIALTYLRMQRCAEAEAEYYHSSRPPCPEVRSWNEWLSLRNQGATAGKQVIFKYEVFERMVKLIDLYDARLTNQWLKLLHEVERLQRLREARNREAGDVAQPPPAVQISANTQVKTPVPKTNLQPPAPAATQTSCPPSEKLKFVPPAPQPPSAGRNYLPASSQSEPPELETPESSQARNAAECVIPWPGEKTNPICRNV